MFFAASFVCQNGTYPVRITDAQGTQSIECVEDAASVPHLAAGLLVLMITGQMILKLLMRE